MIEPKVFQTSWCDKHNNMYWSCSCLDMKFVNGTDVVSHKEHKKIVEEWRRDRDHACDMVVYLEKRLKESLKTKIEKMETWIADEIRDLIHNKSDEVVCNSDIENTANRIVLKVLDNMEEG